jgi:sec-independent protein translocase protein TatA
MFEERVFIVTPQNRYDTMFRNFILILDEKTVKLYHNLVEANMLGGIGVQEIVIILIVGLLVFGATRLPKIARSLGQGIKEFKKTVKGLDEDEEQPQSAQRYMQQPPPYPQQQYQQYPPQSGQAQQPYGQQPYGPQGTGPVQGQQPPQGQYGTGTQDWTPETGQQGAPPQGKEGSDQKQV